MKTPLPLCARAVLITCLAAVGSVSAAAPGGPPGGQQPMTVVGRVEGFNLQEQRGTLDGLILNSNGVRIQVNLPEAIVDAVAKSVFPGDIVQATILPEGGGRGGPGHGGRGGPPDDGRGGPPPPQE